MDNLLMGYMAVSSKVLVENITPFHVKINGKLEMVLRLGPPQGQVKRKKTQKIRDGVSLLTFSLRESTM